MSAETLEERVKTLEVAVKRIEHGKSSVVPNSQKWWDKWVGVFAEDELFDEAMRLGFDHSKLQPKLLDGEDVSP